MRRNNNSRFGFIGFFFLLMIFGGAGEILGALLTLAFSLSPFILIYFGIKKLMESDNNRNNNRARTVKSTSPASTVSNAQLAKVDKRLRTYFEDHGALRVIDGVSLVCNGGSYRTLDQLNICYNDERIASLGEFKEKYPDIYSRIFSMLVAFSKQKDEVLAAEVNSAKVEVKKEAVLSDAEKYIEHINDLNSKIPQEEITNGLNLTCDLLKQIDISLKKSDKGNDKTGKLYDYYLPILVSVLEKYKELNDSPVKDEEFKNCETQLIKTILLINEALKSIYSSLHEDDYLNLSADMGTLQTLLAKDGLTENPFGGLKNE